MGVDSFADTFNDNRFVANKELSRPERADLRIRLVVNDKSPNEQSFSFYTM